MDWYKHSKTGSIAWREGNKKIEDYTNIGACYTENLGGGFSMTRFNLYNIYNIIK